ncbi:carbonic anhydrase 9 [Crotalus adamanteus]|uniref:Carbonic anhydrase n=1 Tax=Crotalus adamanteus TaxID=8729 RepID=A0AAW1C2S3_CROAD
MSPPQKNRLEAPVVSFSLYPACSGRAAEVRLTNLHFSSLSSFLPLPNPHPRSPPPSQVDMPEWGSMFPHCEGHMQSPININTTAVSFSAKLGPLLLSGYNVPPEVKLPLKNNGHTVLLGLPKKMTLGGGGFPQPYQAAQLHLHWGSGLTRPGSEHTVDGHRYAGEIHVVHYSSHFESIQEAASEPGGLAVLAAFLQVGMETNEPYQHILKHLSEIKEEGEETVVAGFDVAKLLPDDFGRYFRYNGSLTTPPCYQTVNWTVFNQTVRLSQEQISMLEDTLRGDEDEPIQSNFRHLQDLYGRSIFSSFHSLEKVQPTGFPATGYWDCPTSAVALKSTQAAPSGPRLISHARQSKEASGPKRSSEAAEFASGRGEGVARRGGIPRGDPPRRTGRSVAVIQSGSGYGRVQLTFLCTLQVEGLWRREGAGQNLKKERFQDPWLSLTAVSPLLCQMVPQVTALIPWILEKMVPQEMALTPRILEKMAPQETALTPWILEKMAPQETALTPWILEKMAPQETALTPWILEKMAPQETALTPQILEKMVPQEMALTPRILEKVLTWLHRARLGSADLLLYFKDNLRNAEKQVNTSLHTGDILAILFGSLFVATALAFLFYIHKHRRLASRHRGQATKPAALYVPASTDEQAL